MENPTASGGKSNGYPAPPVSAFGPALAVGPGVAAEPPCSCRRIRAGVRARCARFDRWAQRCDVPSARPGHYAALLEKAQIGPPYVDEQTRRQVHLDVQRSCPALSFFQGGGGRHMLINILFAWVVHDGNAQQEEDARDAEESEKRPSMPAVGYVQGMSFIAMNLLWHAGKEEAAFWVFAAMMQRYDLRQMFEPPDMRGLQMRTFTIAQLLQYTMPELSKHLAEYLQNSLGLILTDWLLTLFSSSMALGPLAELWDQFFVGGYRVIYCLILARLRCLQPWLLNEKDFTRLTHLIRFAHVNFDRVDGTLIARLPRTTASPRPKDGVNGTGNMMGMEALGAAVATGGGAGRLLQRFVLGAAALVSNGGTSTRGFGEEVELDSVEVGGNDGNVGRQAAWTCQDCNGSEDCESWLALVLELIDLKQVPEGVIEGFEQIFDGSSPPSFLSNSTSPSPSPPPIETNGKSIDEICSSPSPPPTETNGKSIDESCNAEKSPEEPVDVCIPCGRCKQLSAEIQRLREENVRLRAESLEVADLRRALAEARQRLQEGSNFEWDIS